MKKLQILRLPSCNQNKFKKTRTLNKSSVKVKLSYASEMAQKILNI